MLAFSSMALARNVYGFIIGLGSANYAISSIKIQSGNSTWYADGWSWHWICPGGPRWFKNGLPTNRSYVVTVYSNGGGSRRISFYLPDGSGDYKAPNTNF